MRNLHCADRSTKRDVMTSTSRTVGRHIILFVVVMVILTAIAIWLGLGPTVHSSTAEGSRNLTPAEFRCLDSTDRVLVQLLSPHAFASLLLSQYLPALVSVQLYCADGDQVRAQPRIPSRPVLLLRPSAPCDIDLLR